MTKTTKKTEEAVKIEDAASAASKVTTKVAEGTREFVRRSAATAKERTDDFYETTNKFNSGLESALTRVAGGYVSILGGIAAATHENVTHALTTVEKLANAESVSEAVRIQSDYVRESTSANIGRARDAAEIVRDMAGESVNMVRENAMKAWPYGQKAA
ncbi:phasin family protein [Pseudahrensia aquimaris]|uniref:Phasin family protein n=1 Tax=Pseudahrensia aquimaris TaxID=744461 RepID=A0ABW3FJL7_9HYPH